jgi:EmrB/QacA subfamily drug resistance transporter
MDAPNFLPKDLPLEPVTPANMPQEATPRPNWAMLVVLSLALAVIILDTTILNVALSSIIRDLGTDIQSIQWVITAYSLTLAALTITGGRLGDLFGRKKMFVLGAILFAVGSLVASMSQSVGVLVIGESLIEGVGAALMMPATSSLLVTNFSGRNRAIAFGIWGGIAGASAALGPILGGFLSTNYSWRWGFRVNLIVVALLVIGSIIIPESRDMKEKKELDVVGVVLSALGLLSLVFGIIESTTYGWWTAKEAISYFGYTFTMPGNLSIVPAFIGLGVLILGVFMVWELLTEKRGHTPLVSMSIFKNRAFSSGLAMTGVMSLGQAGLIFALPVFLQAVRGLDAFHTGLTLLPMSLALLVVAPLSAVMSKKIAPKTIVNVGMILNVLSYWVMYQTLGVHTTGLDMAPGLALFGVGMGMIMSQINNITLSAVPLHQAGEASGISATLRQVGSTLGSAVIGAILIGSLSTNLVEGVKKSEVVPEAYKAQLEEVLATQTSNVEFGGGAQTGSQLPESIKTEIITIGHAATVEAAKNTFAVGGLFAILGLLASVMFLPSGKKKMKEAADSLLSTAVTTEQVSELIKRDIARRALGNEGLGPKITELLKRS